jgi:hypothetical protein
MSKKEANLAALLIILMNSQSAIEHITREQKDVMLEIIALILGSPNNLMKTQVF